MNANYLETIATKVSQSKTGKLGMIYKTVVTTHLTKTEFETATASRYQSFEKHGAADRLEMRSSNDVWSMDLLIVGTQHLVFAFPSQGKSYRINLGLRISNPDFVEKMVRWYDECVWSASSEIPSKKKGVG